MRQNQHSWLGLLIGGYDPTLFVGVILLLLIGLVAVYHATVWLSVSGNPTDPAYYFRYQLMWAVLGLAAMLVVGRIPYTFWRRVALPMFAATLLLLVVVLFMPARFGSSRFLFNGRVQPSEVAKFALVVYAATWLTSRRDQLGRVEYGLIPFGVIVGFLASLVALQPDIGTAALLAGIGFTLFFIAGARIRHVSLAVLAGVITMILVIATSDYARARVREQVMIWRDPDATVWSQLREVLRVMREGGVIGQGPGTLDEYVFGLHNDFILSALGHAFGLMGITVVIVLFAVVAYRGYTIAARAPEPFAALMAAGMTTWIVLQALVNMAVTVVLLPPTGVTLPFVSYGGSSLVTTMAAVGVLLNISQTVPGSNRRYADFSVGRGHGGTRVSHP